MTERPYMRAAVSEKAERALKVGHPWVFGEEVLSLSGACENGDLADVVSKKGKYLGTGFLQRKFQDPHSGDLAKRQRQV